MTYLRIHPEVADDLVRAKDWYQEIDPELAESFLEEAYQTMELARVAPEQYSKIYKHYRRVLCQRFPYIVVFETDEARPDCSRPGGESHEPAPRPLERSHLASSLSYLGLLLWKP
ncbi:MAG: type II toxin-antitoxin system RelE/ParE family toxin [Verrucomicrobiota bacterium]